MPAIETQNAPTAKSANDVPRDRVAAAREAAIAAVARFKDIIRELQPFVVEEHRIVFNATIHDLFELPDTSPFKEALKLTDVDMKNITNATKNSAAAVKSALEKCVAVRKFIATSAKNPKWNGTADSMSLVCFFYTCYDLADVVYQNILNERDCSKALRSACEDYDWPEVFDKPPFKRHMCKLLKEAMPGVKNISATIASGDYLVALAARLDGWGILTFGKRSLLSSTALLKAHVAGREKILALLDDDKTFRGIAARKFVSPNGADDEPDGLNESVRLLSTLLLGCEDDELTDWRNSLKPKYEEDRDENASDKDSSVASEASTTEVLASTEAVKRPATSNPPGDGPATKKMRPE